jgi:alanine racemase
VFAVGEGLELREAEIDAPILVLGPALPQWVEAALANKLTLAIPAMDYVQPIVDAARGLGVRAPVHVKVDTGMTRLGLNASTAVEEIAQLHSMPELEVQGIFTHFADADDPHARGIPTWGDTFTQSQMDLLLGIEDKLEARGIKPKYLHAANSPGSVHYQHPRLNLARGGILLYGLHPSGDSPRPDGFKPALAFKTRLALVREVPAGRFVSYGSTFETKRPTRVGVLMVGYADGFRRAPTNYGQVLVRGVRVPIIGRVCMDQTMIDVTDVPEAQTGDEVVLLGIQGSEEISAEEVGENIGTNNYESVTTISARVPRVYMS